MSLLDDRALRGQVDLRCLLGPSLNAVLLDRADLSHAKQAIEDLSQTWGGACYRLYAVESGCDELPDLLLRDEDAGAINVLQARGLLGPGVDDSSPHEFMVYRDGEISTGEALLPLLVSAGHSQDWSVASALVDLAGPWAIASLGTLGCRGLF